jgi:galactonate dehydratase
MQITGITTHTLNIRGRSRALLKVDTDAGVHGWGEAYSTGPDLSVAPIADYLLQLVAGHDPRRIEFLLMKIHQQLRFPPGGVGLAVVSAFDHALWDISGKAAGLPVYQLLGGRTRDRVRVYHGISGGTGAEAATHAQELHDAWGFTAFKTSPYLLDPDANRWGRLCAAAADFFQELREQSPDDWEFAFDPHAKIFEPTRALQLAIALAPYDPYFYEEPLRPEHIPAWRQLRAQLQVPLATGECLFGKFEFLDLLSNQAADIIQPDVCICGGLLEMRKIAAIAEAHYVPVAPHNPMGPLATAVNAHFAIATPNFKVLEYVLPDAQTRSRFDHVLLPEDGYLQLSDRPGFGIDVDEAALASDEYVHWERRSPTRPDGSTGYI